MALQPDDVLDARGLHCPLPLLKAKQALARLDTGAVLYVMATDPGSWKDFETFVGQSNDVELVSREEAEDEYRYWIRKGAAVT